MKETRFKQTEIGEIPKDWEVKEFDDIFTHIPSKRFQISSDMYEPYGKYPVIDQGKEKIIGYSSLENKVFKNGGTIIFGDHTRIFKYADFSFIIGADGIQLLQCKNEFDLKFLYYCCSILKIPNTGYNRHFKFLKESIFPLPPTLEEQNAIAKVLSDVDNVISTLEKLIAKKKNIKQGAMQELLTGKVRVAQVNSEELIVNSGKLKETEIGKIPEDWEVKRLGDFCKIKDGTHGTYKRVDNGNLLLSAKNVIDNQLIITNDESYVSTSDFAIITANGFPKKGDLLVSCVGSIGRCCILNIDNVAFQRSVAFIRQNLNDNIFLMYSIQSNYIQNQLETSKNASTLGGVYIGALEELMIILPPTLEEQNAIAEILSNMDKEIDTLNKKLQKYRAIKTGMMQQLLTGKIRLI